MSNLIQAVANKRSQHEKLVNNNEDDDDYVEADSVARDASEDIKDDDISVLAHQVQSNTQELVHKDTDSSHAEWTKSKDKRYVFKSFLFTLDEACFGWMEGMETNKRQCRFTNS